MDEQQGFGSPTQTASLLAGRYEIRSLVGQGGIAEVYSAFDRVLRRKVAVKVLRESLAGDRRAVARFRREARAAASLGHPYIVSLHDVGLDGEVPFMVMELVTGETLSEVIWRESPLSPERATEIGAQIAEALAFAHHLGLTHQDVKPGNIMLSRSGQVKVLDFGIARAWEPPLPTDPREVLGTAEYVSPEQAQGLPRDGRSDIYSLGVVLYEMLTGRAPFEGQTPSAVAGMHARVDPLPPRRVRPEIPAALEAIVVRCLQKDPRGRYQRAAQLAADLRRFHASGSGIAATLRRFHASGSGITATLLPSRTTDELEPQLQRGGRTSTRRDRRPPRRRTSLALVVVLLVVAAGLMAPFLVRSEGTPSPKPTARPALAAPMGLAAKASCDGFLKAKVRLTWFPGEARSTDGYAVYRSESSEGPYRLIELLSGRSTTATTDPHLNTSTTYRYVVRATSGTRMSPYSQSVQADTPGFCLF